MRQVLQKSVGKSAIRESGLVPMASPHARIRSTSQVVATLKKSRGGESVCACREEAVVG
jgi:hypothetical protein